MSEPKKKKPSGITPGEAISIKVVTSDQFKARLDRVEAQFHAAITELFDILKGG